MQLLRRIDDRDLYKVCGENIISEEQKAAVKKNGQQEIASLDASGRLHPDDIIVHTYRLDWGNGDNYPLDSINFFNTDNQLVKLPRHETSQYRPR